MTIINKPAIIVTALIYLAIVMAIGFWAVRRTKSSKDFFIAGQGIGLIVTALATMSAAFSGFVFIGGPGLTYKIGMSSLFIVLPVSFSAGLICWVVAKRLRLLTEVREAYTIPDAIYYRYKSRSASGLAAVAVVIGSISYLGAQILAMGILIQSIFNTKEVFGSNSLAIAMGIGLVVVLFYAIAGGMIAGVYTDLFQGAIMVGAAAAVFYYAASSGGGMENITRTIVESETFGAKFMDPLGNIPIFMAIGFFIVFAVGNIGQPHMLHKFYMLDNPKKLKWMPLVVGLTQVMCVLIWLGIGLAVPALVTSGNLEPLTNPDNASPLFLMNFTPDILAGIVFAGILAAIMSTADSFVNIGSAALIRDIPRAMGWQVNNELLLGRIAVFGIAIVAAVFALFYGDLIALLGTFAFGTFGAALAPAIGVGLNWKGITKQGAAASIATGMILNIVLEFFAKQKFFPGLPKLPVQPGVLPTAVSLMASFTVLFTVSYFTRNTQGNEIDADIEKVMEM